MRVELIREDCDDKPICPSLWRTDRGTTAVQGWDTDHPDTVEVPAKLLEGVQAITGEVTERGTILVRGTRVTDAEALAMMGIPDGESAVELPIAVCGGRRDG
jgi:hypothetical protein